MLGRARSVPPRWRERSGGCPLPLWVLAFLPAANGAAGGGCKMSPWSTDMCCPHPCCPSDALAASDPSSACCCWSWSVKTSFSQLFSKCLHKWVTLFMRRQGGGWSCTSPAPALGCSCSSSIHQFVLFWLSHGHWGSWAGGQRPATKHQYREGE